MPLCIYGLPASHYVKVKKILAEPSLVRLGFIIYEISYSLLLIQFVLIESTRQCHCSAHSPLPY